MGLGEPEWPRGGPGPRSRPIFWDQPPAISTRRDTDPGHSCSLHVCTRTGLGLTLDELGMLESTLEQKVPSRQRMELMMEGGLGCGAWVPACRR